MRKEEVVELFNKNLEYYDKSKTELNTILSLMEFKPQQTLIDIGAGIGRLSFPLSKHLKVTAVETRNELVAELIASDIRIIDKKIEEYFPEEKFNYALIAWPEFHNHKEVLNHIRERILKEDGKLIIIKSKEHSLKALAKTIFPESFGKGKDFLNALPDFFHIEQEKTIETNWIYPSFNEAQRLVGLELEAFYNKRINEQEGEIVNRFIREHEFDGKVVLNAELKFLVCKSKN